MRGIGPASNILAIVVAKMRSSEGRKLDVSLMILIILPEGFE